MSKCVRRTDSAVATSNGKVGSAPYTVAARRERSRELAQQRRTTYKSVMEDLTQALPFPNHVVSQLDYNSRLRLSLCFFRLKTLLANEHVESNLKSDVASGGADSAVEKEMWSGGESKSTAVVQHKFLQPGMLQSMMAEALDGFLLVASSEGTIVYLSESVHNHLGIFQSEHIGIDIYDIISEDDHETVREAVTKAETEATFFSPGKRGAQVEFFCRMKCSRFKVANTITKSPGFKVVYVSGSIKVMRGSHFLVTVVRPVSPPSILEIRMEANMFVSHYSMELSCVFFDGRLRHLLGYKKHDIEGRSPFHFQHHDDVAATTKCGQGIVDRGEGLSGYYRFLTQFGHYVWLQTRGSLMYDSLTSKPTHMVFLNYIISKDLGERDLGIRQAITANLSGLSESSTHSYDPFPVLRMDGSVVNPLHLTSWKHKFGYDDYDIHDYLTESEKGVEPKGDVTAAKEEMLLQEELEYIPDSGVHSSSSSLEHSHCGSLTSSVGSPDTRAEDLHCNGNTNSGHDQLSPEDSLSSVTEQVPLGQAPPGQAPLGQTPFPGHAQCPVGQARSLGQLLGEGLPAWESQSPPSMQPDTTSMHHDWVNGHFHGDTILPETLQEKGSAFQFQNGEPNLYQKQNGEPKLYPQQNGEPKLYQKQNGGPNPYQQQNVDTDLNVYLHATCMGTAQKTYPQTSYDLDTFVPDQVTEPHPQVSFKQYSMNATATVEMINIPSLFTQQYDPSPSRQPSRTNQSELQKLLTQQVPPSGSRDEELPNLPPYTGVWSTDVSTLPQLTGEDLEMLDFVAK